jgi:importin-5
MRSFAAVLLRKMASKTVTREGKSVDLFLNASAEVQNHIKTLILQCFAEETVNTVRNKIGDAISELARQILEAGMEGILKIRDQTLTCVRSTME